MRSEERFLERAQEEERIYNWIEAANLYRGRIYGTIKVY